MSPATRDPTWKEDLADVQRVGFWLWVALLWVPSLTLSTLGGPQVGEVLFKAVDSGRLGAAEASTLWNALVLTAPFTAAVALMGIAILRGGLRSDELFPAIYLGAAVLMLTTVLAQSLGIGASVEILEVSPIGFQPFAWIINLSYSYAQVYTPWMLITSTAIGGFLAWAWSVKVLPHLERYQSK